MERFKGVSMPKPLTKKDKRRPAPGVPEVRFLLEDFIAIADVAAGSPVNEGELVAMREKAARLFLPSAQKTGHDRKSKARTRNDVARSMSQLELEAMSLTEFQQLRREVRNWLRQVVALSHTGIKVVPRGRLTLTVTDEPWPLVEGNVRDVVRHHLAYLVSRVGRRQIGICQAPKSTRGADQEGGVESDVCGKLFLKRGEGKRYCSDRCRTREGKANQRSKAWLEKTNRRAAGRIKTRKVVLLASGDRIIINSSDFDPRLHGTIATSTFKAESNEQKKKGKR
jgi:hypothetical protein